VGSAARPLLELNRGRRSTAGRAHVSVRRQVPSGRLGVDVTAAMRLFLAAAVSIAILVPAAQAAQPPTRSQLPKMVLPDAALKRLASALPPRVAFFSTAAEGASSTPDPHDTAADLKRLGRIAGYVGGRKRS
jgi:hypothetical protein